MKRIVLLPIETIAREFDYKLALAHRVSDSNTTCIIGQHNYLNKVFKYFKGGVYFGKNVFPDLVPCSSEFYYKLKENNFSLLYHNEEGGVHAGSEADWIIRLKSQIDTTILQKDDAILCWGEFQTNYYKSLGMSFPIFNVGCPRLDIKPNSDLFELAQKFSKIKDEKFILINTNFALVNHMMGLTAELNYLKSRDNDGINDLHKINLWYSSVFKKMGSFLQMIVMLIVENPSQKFVIRPHPTESLEVYDYLQSVYPNLEVSNSDNAVNWISKCKLLIQNNCTTSLEAFFMKVPVINFQPTETPFSVNVLNDVGQNIESVDELQQLISQNVIDAKSNLSESSKIKSLINNFVESKSSIETIAEIIDKFLENKERSKVSIFALRKTFLKNKIRNALFYFPRFLFPSKLKAYKMHKSHFLGFNKKETVDKIDFLNKKNHKSLKIQFLNKELFIISS